MSEVNICQMAVAHLRAGTIGSLDEPSIAAQNCKLFYATLRDVVLESADWSFARKVKPLQQLSSNQFGWRYAYQYPSDCMRVNKVMINYESSADDSVEYRIANIDGEKVILANELQLRIDYRSRVENTSLFSPTFKLALSYLIASEIAISLVGVKEGGQLKKMALNMYVSYLSSAIANDGNEEQTPTPDSEYVLARR